MTQQQNEGDWKAALSKKNAELDAKYGWLMLAWIDTIEAVKWFIVRIEGSDYTDRKRWILSKGKKKHAMPDHDIIEMLRERLGEGPLFPNLVETLHKGRRARNSLAHRLGEISSRGMIRDSNELSVRDTRMRNSERKVRLIKRYEPFITRACESVGYCLLFHCITLPPGRGRGGLGGGL